MQNGQPAPESAPGAIDTPVLPLTGQEYADILRKQDIGFTETECHLNIGTRPDNKGWILHLSVIYTQMPRLLEACLPLLISSGTAFRIAKHEEMLGTISTGKFGKEHIGKVFTLYPSTPEKALELARELVILTQGYKGPFIYTDILLGGIVYTRYAGTHPKILEDTRPLGEQMIANLIGQRIPDLLFDPYYLPEGVSWPFSSLKIHEAPPAEKLLNNKYTITKTLKADLKGSVYQASYFTGFTHEPCVIKCANRFVSVDKTERDNADRLQWQWHLHQVLRNIVPVPRVFEIFEKEHSTYLAMEFVKGISLRQWINKQRRNRHWQHIPAKERKALINMLLRLLDIIDNMHKAGFLHRDITTQNFLVGERSNLTLIDMELSYPVENDPHQPLFGLGSPGYMSPEQEGMQTPAVSQDIYAIGALMFNFFTGLSAQKIYAKAPYLQEKQLLFLTADADITALIMSCIHQDPEQRPAIIRVKEALYLVLQQAEQRNPITCQVDYSGDALQLLPGEFDFQGFQQGLFRDFMAHLPGVDKGKAGMTICVAGAIRNRKLTPTPEISDFLAECFLEEAEQLDISEGIAGQGLALLECIQWITDVQYRRDKLDGYVSRLITQQQADGSWPLKKQEDGNIPTGIWDGVAGILIYLIEYQRRRKQVDCTEAIVKGLKWIAKQQKGDYYMDGWYHSELSGPFDVTSFSKGSIGIAQLFIKAYLLLEDPQYKQMATHLLEQIPDYIVRDSFNVSTGLPGLGEAYILAWLAFGEKKWQDRAEWIVALTQHIETTQTKPFQLFWRGQSFSELANARPGEYEPVLLYSYLGARNYMLEQVAEKS